MYFSQVSATTSVFVNFIYLFPLLLGAPANTASGIPLPDQKTLELILDKLQKYGFLCFGFGVYDDMNDCIAEVCVSGTVLCF